ncbi:MAG TPA: acetate--CoA ligase family protein [Desulfomonilaceae bacterium]|nr:acetate--CoA ligase family protein [Desulfomonilaceae bacterium]
MKVIEKALSEGRTTLSEYESKQLLAEYGIPVAREFLVHREEDLFSTTARIGFPLVLKGCSSEITHKTEKNLVRTDVRTDAEALQVFRELRSSISAMDSVLVQEMVQGKRELMAGLTRDAQFGPCVMFGLGGIFTEILKDVAFRLAPITQRDALEMMSDIRGAKILEAVRGLADVDKDATAQILMNLGRIGVENDRIQEIDVNPLIIRNGKPIAVDALVVLHPA